MTQAIINKQPATMILVTPKRVINAPVTRPGANMPMMCHSNTIAVDENG